MPEEDLDSLVDALVQEVQSSEDDEEDEERSIDDMVDSLLAEPEDEEEVQAEGNILPGQDDEVVAEGDLIEDAEAAEEEDLTSMAKELFDNFDELDSEGQKDAIELAMREDATWKEWFDSGTDANGQPDRDLAILAARSGLGPDYLSRHGIYSLQDFQERLESEVAKTDPKAWILADPENPEEVDEFLEERWGIPIKREDYGDEWYVGTKFEDEHQREQLLDHIEKMRLSKGQATYLADMMERSGDILQRRETEALNKYVADGRELLQKVYKDHLPQVLDGVSRALHGDPFGKKVLEEFGNTKFLNSPNVISFLHNALFGHQTSWKQAEEVELPNTDTQFQGLSTTQIRSMIKDLEGREHHKGVYAQDPDPKVRRAHENIHILIERLRDEFKSR